MELPPLGGWSRGTRDEGRSPARERRRRQREIEMGERDGAQQGALFTQLGGVTSTGAPRARAAVGARAGGHALCARPLPARARSTAPSRAPASASEEQEWMLRN